MPRKRIREHELPALLRTLEEGTTDARRKALRRACPCRGGIFNRDLWRSIFRALEHGMPEVRKEAAHAIATLKVVEDDCARVLLEELERDLTPSSRKLLLEQDHEHLKSHLRDEGFRAYKDKLPKRQLVNVMQTLERGSHEEQIRALRLLCPCRNRIYDSQVWKKIAGARNSPLPEVGHQADHAICTLRERALHDPRSWRLLLELEREGNEQTRGSALNVGFWGPRSRPSRRKRMTRCRSGRLKALASVSVLAKGGIGTAEPS